MKSQKIKIILIILCCYLGNNTAYSQVKPNRLKNPLLLDYEFYDLMNAEDGTPVYAYIEKGSEWNNNYYEWSKTVPMYASAEFKDAYEYHLDFTLPDLNLLLDLIDVIMDQNLKMTSIDNPGWYQPGMRITKAFEYCKKNNTNITFGMLDKMKGYLAMIVFDSGSKDMYPTISLILFRMN
jgi:hypothetical protein